MTKKFYAVKKGLVPGIYEDWDSCKAQVNTFPGAQYKGFSSRAQACAYLGISADDEPAASRSGTDLRKASPKTAAHAEPAASSKYPGIIPAPGCAIAYVDGSFREGIKKFAYGIVFFSCSEDGSVCEKHFSKAFTNPELLEMRNVSGEIMGAAQAMKTAREIGLKQITIYHDYEGISKWCLGSWKTNKPWVKKYKAFYDDISQYIKIDFVKVKGHSNDKYNDLADELAKAALE